jgi:hypothetical protein
VLNSRSIRFNFKEEADFEGISVYKYFLDESLVANVSSEPSNWCFNPNHDESQVKDPFDHLWTRKLKIKF